MGFDPSSILERTTCSIEVFMMFGACLVWYICLKTEIDCLKIFVKIHVVEKVGENICNVVKKLKIVV